jgi:hypothetical protein
MKSVWQARKWKKESPRLKSGQVERAPEENGQPKAGTFTTGGRSIENDQHEELDCQYGFVFF